ncbi:MAG TPA: PIN domain-containing protein [Acidisarcina sp.]
MGLILDTSVLIAAERRRQSVLQILKQIQAEHLEVEIGISVVTVAEMTHGAFRARIASDRQRHLTFIDRLSSEIAVYPVGLDAAKLLGRIAGEQAARGIAISFEDLAIGCTALHLGFGVATLNVRHFRLIPDLSVVQF